MNADIFEISLKSQNTEDLYPVVIVRKLCFFFVEVLLLKALQSVIILQLVF